MVPRPHGVLLGPGQHRSLGSHPPEVTGGNAKDCSWEGPEKLDGPQGLAWGLSWGPHREEKIDGRTARILWTPGAAPHCSQWVACVNALS